MVTEHVLRDPQCGPGSPKQKLGPSPMCKGSGDSGKGNLFLLATATPTSLGKQLKKTQETFEHN